MKQDKFSHLFYSGGVRASRPPSILLNTVDLIMGK
jgi:hypothetical protein